MITPRREGQRREAELILIRIQRNTNDAIRLEGIAQG
jgi:hypothetical protein